jgi:transcriptional regulator with XRE-family HTH domain
MKGKEFYSMDISMGDIIKKMIRRKGMKQTDFAEKMGFGKSNISILLNKKDWYVSKVIQASEILEVNLFTYLVRQEDYTSNVLDEETPVWQMMKTENADKYGQ